MSGPVTEATEDEAEFVSIIDYLVESEEAQQQLVDAFARLQAQWVRFYPGYCSATIFASLDGHRVYNVVRWASEPDFRHFEEVSDTAGRSAAIEAAIAAIPGRVEPRMTGAPRFRIARVVTPGPADDRALTERSAADGE